MFFAPSKAARNSRARFTVSDLLADTEEEPAASIVHWLFCSVAEVPGVIGPSQALLASFLSHSTMLIGSAQTQQAPVPLMAVLITTWAVVMSEGPLTSANTKLNIWLLPLPEAG